MIRSNPFALNFSAPTDFTHMIANVNMVANVIIIIIVIVVVLIIIR